MMSLTMVASPTQVSDYILSKAIHAELKCSEPSKTTQPTPVVTPDSETQKRLEELEVLFNKGIITKEEYDSTRARILNDL